jgi:tetratricopeptide (TPR) repeat protein
MMTTTDPKASGLRPPEPPAPFVDRDLAQRRLAEALAAGPGELHVVAGLEGVGKTALVARVVRDVGANFPGGVLWLSLAGGPALEWVRGQIAATYGGRPGGVQATRPLLVVDDAEQAPGVVEALRNERGQATLILITADRTQFGDAPHDVWPLPRPSAVALFQMRTGTGEPALVEELCALVEDLPLAVILAAAYLLSYGDTLEQYLSRLRDSALGKMAYLVDRRGSSVLATFDLLYERLDDDPRLALAVLALDAGPTTSLSAVAAAAGWSDTGRAGLACEALAAQSLATEIGTRYQLHPLLRRYTAGKVPLEQQQLLHENLAAYYLAYAEAEQAALFAEHLQLLATLDYFFGRQQWPQTRRLAHLLDGYLREQGHWAELRRRLAQASGAAQAERNPGEVASFNDKLATLLREAGDLAAARRECETALAILEAEGADPQLVTPIYHHLGWLAQALGETEQAQQWYERCLDRAASEPSTLHELGRLAHNRGQFERAQELYERSLVLSRESEAQAQIARTLHELGRLAHNTGDYGRAQRLYEESLTIKRVLGHRADAALTLHELGRLAHSRRDYDEARRFYEESLAIKEKLGHRPEQAGTLGQLASLAKAAGDLTEAEALYQRAIALSEPASETVSLAIRLFNLALLYDEQKRLAEALPLLERALEIFERFGARHTETARAVLEQVRGKVEES